jgi:hypothetical protein
VVLDRNKKKSYVAGARAPSRTMMLSYRKLQSDRLITVS